MSNKNKPIPINFDENKRAKIKTVYARSKTKPIIDQLKSLWFYCKACRKWTRVCSGTFEQYESEWSNLMMARFNLKCKCGAGNERSMRIGDPKEFKSVDEYFKKCFNYMNGHFKKGVTKRMIKSEGIKVVNRIAVTEFISVVKNPVKDKMPEERIKEIMDNLKQFPSFGGIYYMKPD